MARVPTPRRRVAPARPGPAVLAGPDQYGGAVGRGLENLGGAIDRSGDMIYQLGKQRREEEEQNDTLRLELEARDEMRRVRNEYLTTNQRAAVDGYAGVGERLAEIERDYLGRAPQSATARRALSRALARGRFELGGSIDRHYLAEREADRLAVAGALVSGAAEDMLATPGDPDAYATAQRRVVEGVGETHRGADPRVRAQAEREALSGLALSRIATLAKADKSAALAAIREEMPRLTAEDRATALGIRRNLKLDAAAIALGQGRAPDLRGLRPGSSAPPPLGEIDGVPNGFLTWVDRNESGGSFRERNRAGSSASGRGQLLGSTWRAYQAADPRAQSFGSMRDAPEEIQNDAIRWLYDRKVAALEAQGIEPTNRNVALAWRWGEGLVREINEAPASEMFANLLRRTGVFGKNTNAAIEQNRVGDKSVGEVRAEFDRISAAPAPPAAVSAELKSFEEQLAWVDAAVASGRLRRADGEEIKTQLRRQREDRGRAEADREERLISSVFERIEAGEVRSVADLDPAERVELGEGGLGKVNRYLSASRGDDVETDWAVYESVRERLNAGEDVSLQRYRGELADAEMKELIKLRQKTKADDVPLSSVMTSIDNALGKAGFVKPGKADSPDAHADWYRIERLVLAEVNAHRASAGKWPTIEETWKIAERLTRENQVRDRGILWGLFDSGRQTAIEIDDVSDIPKTDIEQIRAAFAAAGVEPTDDQLIRMYARKLAMEGK
ncbi:MAG: hypothetical protein AAFR16_00370 [Pseudomonadota bacterium]